MCLIPKGACTQIVHTLAPKYLYRDYFEVKVYTIWVHGPLGCMTCNIMVNHMELG